jgi:hypothetical protein
MESTLTTIEEYYELSEFNDSIDIEEFRLICSSPFKMVRKAFTSGILRDIRLQYFGVFEVSKSRIKYSRSVIEENYKNGLISERRYLERLKVLDSYESTN